MSKKITFPLFFGLFLTMLTFEVMAGSDYTWNGSVSSNWNTAGNWNGGGLIPTRVYRVTGVGNSPVISNTPNGNIRSIDVSANGQLSITGGNTAVEEAFAVRGNGELTVSSGNINVAGGFFIYDQASALVVNGGVLNVSQDIFLGESGVNNDANNGFVEVIITGGSTSCNNLVFSNLTGDQGKVTISGGTLTVNGDILANGERVNLEIRGGVVNVIGDLRMDNGNDSLIMNGGTLNIQGDYINDGVTMVSGGTIVFDGSATQNISSPLGVNFYNLSLDNASGFNLTDSIIIQNQLNLTNGVVQTNGNSVTLLDNTSVIGASINSFIDGPINKVGDDPFVFPIGDSSFYKPLGISAPSNSNDVFQAEYRFEDPALISDPDSRELGVNNISKMEYWMLDQTMGLSAVNVTLSWDPNSVVQQPSNLLVVKWDDLLLQWVNLGNGGTTGNANSGSITSNTAVNDFTVFTLGSSNFSNPLPVELESFSANSSNGNAILKWSTLSEVNNAYFEIQKSYDIENVETIARVSSKAESGNSNKRLTYEFVDFDLAFGQTTYYRIKQVDHDGKFKVYDFESVSRKAKVNQGSSVVFNVYPNPNDGKRLFVELENLNVDEYQLGVHNMKGELVFTRSFLVEEYTTYVEMEVLRGKLLKPGVYIIRISSMQNRFSKKIIVE